MGVSIAALIGTQMVVRSIPYEEGFGKKQLAWLAYCGVVGTVLAPMCFLGGPILTRYILAFLKILLFFRAHKFISSQGSMVYSRNRGWSFDGCCHCSK